MLVVKQLNVHHAAIQALFDVDMEMPSGQITSVMGPDGAGKTTLMKAIMGDLKPTSGSILIEDHDVTALTSNRRARAGIALVPPGRQILPKLSVEENLKAGLEARPDRRRTVPAEIYDLLPNLKPHLRRRAGDLSGALQQLLAIGRALAGDPKVLLLDEPTRGLQPTVVEQIGELLRLLVESRALTVALAGQSPDFVKQFAHRFYIINGGRVVAQGTSEELTPEVVSTHLGV